MALGIASAFFLGFPQKQGVADIITRIPSDVTAKTPDGKTVSLSEYKGKVVFMNVWRIDCKPCLIEIPILNKLQQEYSSNDFAVIGVSIDMGHEDIVAAIAKQGGITYPVWLAYGQPLFRYVDVPYTPFLIILGPDGEVLGTIRGAFDDYSDVVSIMNQAKAFVKKEKAKKTP